MTTPASAQITSTGYVAPSYADVLAYVQSVYLGIYGADAVITPNTQDGQLLGIFSQLISDANQLGGAVFNSFSPTFAQGVGLSSLVKINGLRRKVPTNSQIVVTVTGSAGAVITNGQVGDNAGLQQVWNLPASVIIPPGGTIDVTATAAVAGALSAGNNTLTIILTPAFGWTGVTNGTNASSLGAPVETDAGLRGRQSVSTSLPAISPPGSIEASVANVPGVISSKLWENNTASTDANGIPSHSLSMVVQGGDVNAVAQAIFDKKAPGVGTYGSTSVSVTDEEGMLVSINFYELAFTTIYVAFTVHALAGYTSAIGFEIKAAIAAYVNSLDIGDTLYYTKLVAAACLDNIPDGKTFNLTALTVATTPIPVATADIAITFNHRASLDIGNITGTVT